MSDGSQPNILVIRGDDIGITNLSCYGDSVPRITGAEKLRPPSSVRHAYMVRSASELPVAVAHT